MLFARCRKIDGIVELPFTTRARNDHRQTDKAIKPGTVT